ncbi:MAG TPA: ribosome biogenesis GTPase Der [Candidatus Polarisedimenticolia bacterium]|nr:ribosome biogenesis GTPase Der [Candidatus Polarisedimenticolia bacterium]
MPLPVVAIVGAPNVGKSTLFNRMLGRRKAIVSDTPGVTRDRIAAECDLFGDRVALVDTGGVVTGPADDLTRRVRVEAMKAVEEADLILFVVDARAGLTATDLEVAGLLRSSGKPVLTLANKVDAASLEGIEVDLYRLGLGDVLSLSAEQGRGLDELVERIRGALPARAAVEAQEGVPLAIIGRPNVGKSSLFNRIVRDDRVVVDSAPGTTRDPIDALFERAGTLYRIIDTAGIRRRARSGEEIEWVSVLKARQALAEAEIAIAMVDAAAGVEHQDLALIGLLAEKHTPSVLAINKIDLLPGRGGTIEAKLKEIRAALRFSPGLPVVAISALTGRGVEPLLDAVERLRVESRRRFATADLNRALQGILSEKQPPADGGREVRFYYMTQTGGPPPRLTVFGNGRRVTPSYRRFMEGRLRTSLGLTSSPLILSFRRSRSPR